MAGARTMHYTARAGELAVMSELASRGYNVAKVEVDSPDDLIAIDEAKARLIRIQVKTSIPRSGATPRGRIQYEFVIHYPGLMSQRPDPEQDLFFIFVMLRSQGAKKWTYVILPRARLISSMRDDDVGTHPYGKRDEAHLFIEHVIEDGSYSFLSRGHGNRASLAGFLDNWDDFFPVISHPAGHEGPPRSLRA